MSRTSPLATLDEPAVQVGVLKVHLYVREARSLKDKRRVVKSIKDRLRNRFNVSVCELEGKDNRQQSFLGVVMAGEERTHIDSELQKILAGFRSATSAELVGSELEFFSAVD